MSKIKKAIISLDIMTSEAYKKFVKMGHLQEKNPKQIWEYYPKIGEKYNSNTMVLETSTIESYLMLSKLKQENIPCRFWYNNSIFIYNDKLYRIADSEIVKVDTDGLCYISFRESFKHPFFQFLEIILDKKGGRLSKPNKKTMHNIGCMNKMYAFIKLYKMRKTYLQDVIIPYKIQKRDYKLFLEFCHKNLGDKVVFKNDCIQEGKGVIFKDLSKGYEYPEITKSLNMHNLPSKELLISPAYDIKEEYRCYFTNYKKPKVFSIKQRINTSTNSELCDKTNIHIYKNIKVKWLEVKTKSATFNMASTTALKMIRHLQYDTGCLEFALTKDGKLVFFEVNQMAGPLPFAGEDCDNINKYYDSMINFMLKG